MLIVQAIISIPFSTACAIRLSKLSIRFFLMIRRIIQLPAPPIFILDSFSFSLFAGSIQPNILPKISLDTAGFSRFLITLSPQKVKNIVTFFPVEAAPFAMTNEANALSRSSLKTINVLLSALLPPVAILHSAFFFVPWRRSCLPYFPERLTLPRLSCTMKRHLFRKPDLLR